MPVRQVTTRRTLPAKKTTRKKQKQQTGKNKPRGQLTLPKKRSKSSRRSSSGGIKKRRKKGTRKTQVKKKKGSKKGTGKTQVKKKKGSKKGTRKKDGIKKGTKPLPMQSESSDEEKEVEEKKSEEKKKTEYYQHQLYGKFKIWSIQGDGNCMFRAMAYFVLGRQGEHPFIRDIVVQYICRHWDRFKNFSSHEDADSYQTRMRAQGTFGTESEIVAFTDIFKCQVVVFFKNSSDREPLKIGEFDTECYVLYSGVTDCGHYDVLHPTSKVHCDVAKHRESIRALRRKTLEEFEDQWRDFKSHEINTWIARFSSEMKITDPEV